jgi:hypothetical protein
LLLSGVGEKEFPHVYIIGDIIRDGRDHSRLIQKLADKKYKECIFPLNGKVIKKAMNLWGGRCAVARAQYYASTDVRAPELEGTERGELEKIRMRWNEEFVKRLSMDLHQREVEYITSDVLVLVPEEDRVRLKQMNRVEGVCVRQNTEKWSDQYVLGGRVRFVLIWNGKQQRSGARLVPARHRAGVTVAEGSEEVYQDLAQFLNSATQF